MMPRTTTSRRNTLLIAAVLIAAITAFGALFRWIQSRDVRPDAPALNAPSPVKASSDHRAPRTEPPFPNVALSLAGTAFQGSYAVAFISVDGRPAAAYSAGQELAQGVTLGAVLPDRVFLKHGERVKILYLATLRADIAHGAQAPRDTARVPDYQKKNPGIEPVSLSSDYPAVAEEFLREVQVTPGAAGGFLVRAVEPQSLYDKLGLRPGDVIYSLDPPGGESDESIAFLRAEVRLEVYRDGSYVLLTYRPE